MNRRAAEQAVHVFRFAAVAAQQAMFAEYPQIAGLGGRLVGRLGYVVRIGLAGVALGIQQPQHFVVREAGQVQVEVHLLQLSQFLGQPVVVPVGDGRRLVVGDAVCFGLGRRQAAGDMNGHLGHVQLDGRLVARMADDDDVVLIDDERLAEAEFLDRCRHGVHGGVVQARVVVVRPNRSNRTHLHQHVRSPSELLPIHA